MHLFLLITAWALGFIGAVIVYASIGKHSAKHIDYEGHVYYTTEYVSWPQLLVAAAFFVAAGACWWLAGPRDAESTLYILALALLCVGGLFAWASGEAAVFMIGLIVAIVLAICAYNTDTASARHAVEDAAAAKQAAYIRSPHFISDAPEGCKVFGWYDGTYSHYFTKCPNSSVTTEAAHGESRQCGKHTCTKTVYETIKTEAQ